MDPLSNVAAKCRPHYTLRLPATPLLHDVINCIAPFKGGTGTFGRSLQGTGFAARVFSPTGVEWKISEQSISVVNKMAGVPPIRTIVYPSYGADCSRQGPHCKVLLPVGQQHGPSVPGLVAHE